MDPAPALKIEPAGVKNAMYCSAMALIGALTAPQPQLSLPSHLLDHATASPVQFAMALANAGVPAGLEIEDADDVLPPTWPTFARSARRVPASEVVRIFNANNPRYRASVVNARVVVIRPAEARHAFLDGPSSLGRAFTVTGVMAAARRVFSAVSPGLLGPIAGSGSRAGEDASIVLDGTGRTVIDTLNQIVIQAPSRTWVVTTRRDQAGVRAVSFGFIEADGSRNRQGI